MNNYLEKGLFIIENKSKKLSILPNGVKSRIHAIEKLETDFVMEKHINFLFRKHNKEIAHTV